jgi:antitoxin Phd
MGGGMQNWQLQDAKARFSELVKQAINRGPQNITVHGKPAVVIISKQEYDELTQPKMTFISLLRKSPLVGLKLHFERDKSPARDIEL